MYQIVFRLHGEAYNSGTVIRRASQIPTVSEEITKVLPYEDHLCAYGGERCSGRERIDHRGL